MLIRNQIRRNLAVIGPTILPADKVRMTKLIVRVEKNTTYVRGDVVAGPDLVTQKPIDAIKDLLTEAINRSVVLEIGIIPETVILSASGVEP